MATEDPVEARLLHARNQLNRKIAQDAALSGEDLVEVRDDVVFIYQFYMNYILRVERESKERDKALEASKMNRNPTLTKVLWVLLPTLATGLLAFIGYIWGQGSSS